MAKSSSRSRSGKPKRSSSWVWTLVVLAVLGWLWNKIERPRHLSPTPVASTAGSSAANEADATPTAAGRHYDSPYALSATRDSWPPLDSDAAAAGTAAAPDLLNYYLVLDGSGSMARSECAGGSSKIKAAITALSLFLPTIPAEANVGLAVFDRRGLSERVSLGTGNRDVLRRAFGTVEVANGTPLRSAITLGYQQLTAQARKQLGYGEYHLVVITDGEPEPASEDPGEIVSEMLDDSPVILHTIGFCIGEEHVLNQPGRTYYLAADDPQQLRAGLDAVLAEAPVFDVTRFKQ